LVGQWAPQAWIGAVGEDVTPDVEHCDVSSLEKIGGGTYLLCHCDCPANRVQEQQARWEIASEPRE
jgi:hypothetical protein